MTKKIKIRADILLVELALAPTRSKAQSLIMAGVVYFGTQRIDKASELFPAETKLHLKGLDHPFVSRGGVKLDAALTHFKLDVNNLTCMDVGASTGGFTDCLLQRGAKKIYAIDVGYGQLDWKIRSNPLVIVKDRTNFRLMNLEDVIDPINLIVIDASFISLKILIPKAKEFLTQHLTSPQYLVALIKPQFEVGRENIGKGGIVKDEAKKSECVTDIQSFCTLQGFDILGIIPSPIKGQDGNEEFLIGLSLEGTNAHK